MARLRSSSKVVSDAIGARTAGMGARATGRTLGKSHTTIFALGSANIVVQAEQWSPPASADTDVTVKGDEVYPRVSENLPPNQSEGWTLHFVECASCSWGTAKADLKDELLFQAGGTAAWAGSKPVMASDD